MSLLRGNAGALRVSRLAGDEDVNDAQRLSQDPAFRRIGSERIRRWLFGARLRRGPEGALALPLPAG